MLENEVGSFANSYLDVYGKIPDDLGTTVKLLSLVQRLGYDLKDNEPFIRENLDGSHEAFINSDIICNGPGFSYLKFKNKEEYEKFESEYKEDIKNREKNYNFFVGAMMGTMVGAGAGLGTAFLALLCGVDKELIKVDYLITGGMILGCTGLGGLAYYLNKGTQEKIENFQNKYLDKLTLGKRAVLNTLGIKK